MTKAPRAQSAKDVSHRNLANIALAASVLGLGVGAALRVTSQTNVANVLWIGVAAGGAVYAAIAIVSALRQRRVGVDVIALLAVVGAIAVGEYLAAAVIGVMIASGRSLESWAGVRARRSLDALVSRVPSSARRYHGSQLETVALGTVRPGDRLAIGPGELVPVDGTVVSAVAVLDESTLTGESKPMEHALGEPIRSGTVNAGGPFDLQATTSAEASTYAGLIHLVATTQADEAPFVRLADRFAAWFLAVTALAAGLAWILVGPSRAVAVLVVATPCPLILAAPVALISGVACTARRGVIVRSGGVLERLGRCRTLLIDKTGTLTEGRPKLLSCLPADGRTATEVLRLAASLDQVSPHVLAVATVQGAQEQGLELTIPDDVEEIAGRGIRGTVEGHRIAVGNAAWAGLSSTSPRWVNVARRKARMDGAMTVFVSIDDQPAGVLAFDDPIRPDTRRTIRALRRAGIERIVIVTGDRLEVAESVGEMIGVDSVLAERTPAEKLEAVRLECRRAPTIMVGDGVNDAPALAQADVGIAMGARGASASSEAADVVLTVDRIDRIGDAVLIGRRTRRIAVESVIAGMGMSVVAMGAAAAGLLPAAWGALLQEGIDVAAILNALRALRAGGVSAPLNATNTALAKRFRDEHRIIRLDIDEIRSVADALGALAPDHAMARVRAVHRRLVDEVLPHEQAEEEVLYPAMTRVLGGTDPTGTMSRAHVEISHQIHRLGRLLEELGTGTPDDLDITELRRILYGLHAILLLHTTQEDEDYLSLGSNTEELTKADRP